MVLFAYIRSHVSQQTDVCFASSKISQHNENEKLVSLNHKTVWFDVKKIPLS